MPVCVTVCVLLHVRVCVCEFMNVCVWFKGSGRRVGLGVCVCVFVLVLVYRMCVSLRMCVHTYVVYSMCARMYVRHCFLVLFTSLHSSPLLTSYFVFLLFLLLFLFFILSLLYISFIFHSFQSFPFNFTLLLP